MKRVIPLALLFVIALAVGGFASVPMEPLRIDQILSDGRVMIYAGVEEGVIVGTQFNVLRDGKIVGKVVVESAEAHRSIASPVTGFYFVKEWDTLVPLTDPIDNMVLHGMNRTSPTYLKSDEEQPNVAVREEVDAKQKIEEPRKIGAKGGIDEKEVLIEKEPPPAEVCSARIIALAGKCDMMLKSKGGNGWVSAKLNQCLAVGDMVRTSKDGLMAVGFGGTPKAPDTQADINVSSVVTISEL